MAFTLSDGTRKFGGVVLLISILVLLIGVRLVFFGECLL
jgi:hypothetical protein